MTSRIYLDNNATTFLDPRVTEVVIASLKTLQGNPSSVHSYGQQAKAALNKARRTVADYLQVKSSEVLFTSNGSEGMNLLIRGAMGDRPEGHIVTSSVEHSCVFASVKFLEALGCQATYLNPGLWGTVTPEAVAEAITPKTKLIVLMAVNNETGVKTDIAAIASLAQERKIPFVVDGVAWLGKEPLGKLPPGVSALCFSGHKFHAPKGVGAVFIRNNFKIAPLLLGGEQEHGKRGGTENLSSIEGLAEAIRLLETELPAATHRMTVLRDKVEQALLPLGGVTINGQDPRICNTSNLSFAGIEGETLLTKLDLNGIAVSHGSACSSGALEPSRVLLNMGIPRNEAATSLRISLSRMTTEAEVDRTIEILTKIVKASRKN